MAAPRKKPPAPIPESAEDERPNYTLEFDDDSYTAETLTPALESLFAEMGVGDGGQASVHISKIDADGRGTESNIWRGDPDDYDLEQLAKKFGSGSYRVKVYVRISSGQRVIKGNKVFSWLLSPEDEAKRQAALNPPPAGAAGINPVDISRMVAEAVRAAVPVAPPTVALPNPMEMLKDLAGVLAVLQPAQSAQAVNPLGMMKDMLEVMNTVRGDMEPMERGSNATGADLLLAMVNKFGPVFEKVLAGGLPALAHASPGGPGAAQLQGPQAPQQVQQVQQAQPPAPQSQEEEVSMKFSMGLNFLVTYAKAGADPVTYANMVLDSVPADAVQALLSMPNPIGYMAGFVPEVKVHEVWFNKLLDEVRSMVDDEAQGQGGEHVG